MEGRDLYENECELYMHACMHRYKLVANTSVYLGFRPHTLLITYSGYIYIYGSIFYSLHISF